MHRNIKFFNLEGIIKDDAHFIRLREQFEHLIIMNMREKGYIPVLDLSAIWTTNWNNEGYDFELVLYGFYVGKVQSWNYEGWTNGRLIPRSTVNHK